MRNPEDGFTLIELLVVVLVIGVLAAIAIPRFLAQREMAHRTNIASAVRSAVPLVEGWFATNRAYPADGTDLATIGAADNAGMRLAFVLTPGGYRINGSHPLLDGDGDGDPNDGDVDAWYDSDTGRIEQP